ncbi:MAG: FHA domain-containing protein, partial [Acidobacteriota bacterium]
MSAGWSYFLDFKDQAFELSEGESTVGRSRACHIAIDDPSVSRRHVVLKADSGRILLQDLGSSNGTFVNGAKIEHSAELHHGDALGLGDADVAIRIIGMSAFETVRMDAVPAQQHGDATLFLQEASAKLAQEAISHEPPPAGGPAVTTALPTGVPDHMAPPPVQPPAPANHMAPPPIQAPAQPPEPETAPLEP